MFLKQTSGTDDIKNNAAYVELFLGSKLGDSPKRNVTLLGRELRSDFHHNETTSLIEVI